jgi:hypothetical protein
VKEVEGKLGASEDKDIFAKRDIYRVKGKDPSIEIAIA